MPRVVALVLFAVLVVGGVLAVPTARSASPDVVVSQVYAGGGNAGAPFANDYVELFNRGSSSIDVSGWTIQYASAAGTTWQATALTGSIAPGRHYLVQLASAAAVGAPLPTPDATGTTNLAVSGGKVAVVRDATPLTCGATRRKLLGRDLGRRPRRVRHRRRLRGRRRRRPPSATRLRPLRGGRRVRRHGRQPDGLRRRRADAAQLVQRRRHLRRRAAADGRRLAGRDGRHRHPVVALDRARATERSASGTRRRAPRPRRSRSG